MGPDNQRMKISDRVDPAHVQRLLDTLPAPLEPLDASALDGYLCGVLLQPAPPARWLSHVHDADGRPAPAGVDLGPLHALVRRRHAELDEAIGARRWFDPWVWELDDATPSQTVLPWAAGFATALELFPALLERHEAALLEPLALVYMHLPRDAIDDDHLGAEIDSIETPNDLAEAVEGLVRATLLMADVSRPRADAGLPPPAPSARSAPGRRSRTRGPAGDR
jgi:uncharacterized protein